MDRLPWENGSMVPLHNENASVDMDVNGDNSLTFYTDPDALRNNIPPQFLDSQSHDVASNIQPSNVSVLNGPASMLK